MNLSVILVEVWVGEGSSRLQDEEERCLCASCSLAGGPVSSLLFPSLCLSAPLCLALPNSTMAASE